MRLTLSSFICPHSTLLSLSLLSFFLSLCFALYPPLLLSTNSCASASIRFHASSPSAQHEEVRTLAQFRLCNSSAWYHNNLSLCQGGTKSSWALIRACSGTVGAIRKAEQAHFAYLLNVLVSLRLPPTQAVDSMNYSSICNKQLGYY